MKVLTVKGIEWNGDGLGIGMQVGWRWGQRQECRRDEGQGWG